MATPIAIGIIGMGGFARTHHEAILTLEASGICRLVCTCDPTMEHFTGRQEELQFAQRDVRLYTDYREMLDAHRDELAVVTIPTPIPLHAPMHRACVERGLAVYLEKPPTVDYRELARMLAVEQDARTATMVGFNYIVEPQRQALKQRMVNGEFGAVRRVAVRGLWPRSSAYYARADWAGRLMLNDRLVLDSCLGNAMAHFVHNGLFWGGVQDCWQWGSLAVVEAELYRAHAIEGTDTVFVKASLHEGPELLIGMTHACDSVADEREWVECERATILQHWELLPDGRRDKGFTITWGDGRVEHQPNQTANYLQQNLTAYFQYVRGEVARPLTRLEDSRAFVELNDLAYVAAGHITQVPADMIRRRTTQDTVPVMFVEISGIVEVIDRFLQTGDFPSTQGVSWAAHGGKATSADLPCLHSVMTTIAKRHPAFGSCEPVQQAFT